uniref:F-box domain-containing protein n=1 Tax=Eutreptiella gymnastica TaxID=73025 RepID=A0A7S4FPG2_9EUGL
MAAPFEGQERIQATSTPTLLRLPQEMVLQMLSYLTVQDISMFSLVSMCCAQLCGKEQVWSALLCQCVWPRPGAVAWAGKDCKQVCMQLFRWPPPQHGWFFDTQFTVDHYGSIDLRKGPECEMQWCQSYVQVKQGFCYADFDIGQADTAITMTAWLRTEKESHLSCKCSEGSCVNYFIDYEADGNWHLLALVEKGDSSDWYMDGQFVYTYSGEGFLNRWQRPGTFCLGRVNSSIAGKPEQFDGRLCQVCLWACALTPEHIFNLFHCGLRRPL